MKNIARRAVPLAPTSIRDQIETEIDAGDGEVLSITRFGRENPDAEKDGQGNTNTNLNKTFRTKDQLDEEERTHRRE